MKKNSIFSLILALAAGLTLATACDTSSEVTESDSARDCLITSATMGTLKRQVHMVNAAGRDTTYTYTVTGAAYNLTIDQVNNRIFNEDSLPTGTRTDKLVFASSSGISSTGTLAIKSLYSGKDTLYTYTDSTDFSVKREVSVYDTYGERKRTYTFDIRVHRQEADSTAWQQVAANPLSDVASFVKSRALTAGNTLYVFGQRADGKVQVVQTSVMAPDFDGSAANISTTGFDVRSVTHFDGHFYALANGTLMHSANAAEGWQTATTHHTFSAIAGCTADSIYAISNAQMWASANGTDWVSSAIDTDAQLPAGNNVASATVASRINKPAQMLVMVGIEGGKANVWKHDIDSVGGFFTPWYNLPQTSELGAYACPVVQQHTLFGYDTNTVLAGLSAEGVVAPFYVSRDNGRTWRTDVLTHPALTGATSLAVTTDASNYIWLICGGTGVVYKGRINRLGWE